VRFLGDRERAEDPRAAAADVARALDRAGAAPRGPERHAAVVAALVRAGEVAQGLADAEREAGDGDVDGPRSRAAMALVMRLAVAVDRSWRTGGRLAPPEPAAVDPLLALPLPGRIAVRPPEGYAQFALYPEAYAEAARALGPEPELTVVGIRSIGTGLGAMVAAAAGARRSPVTVRPIGDPYARTVALSPSLARTLAARVHGKVAVVDEGPGRSGSSFLAVVDALEALGVDRARIHLFPSHPGMPGPEASAVARARYAGLARHPAPLGDLLLRPGSLSVARLAEDVVGRAEDRPDDLGAGGWRTVLLGADARRWPPSQGWLERRKYLLRAGGRTWLARFAGLGSSGEHALERARALAGADLWPDPAALRHGLLYEPWLADARPLPVATAAAAALRGAVRRRIELAAGRPRDDAGAGASPGELLEMACSNAVEAHGEEAGRVLRSLEKVLPDVSRSARACEVDGRMQPWKWLVVPDGRVLKADGIDHHASVELAGCQDALWDVAGAQLELGLDDREAWRLGEAARARGPGADPALLPFYRTCLAALEVGRWTFALAGEPPGPERGRRLAQLERYRRLLGREIAALARGRGRGVETSAGAADAETGPPRHP
jgi:hypothetical protein